MSLESRFNLTSDLNSISSDQMTFSLAELKQHFEKYNILPPRTGHLGDWKSFQSSQGTCFDFNSNVCELKFARPLVVGTNWTETSNLDSGDIVYRPGTRLNNNQPEQICLETFSNSRWIEVDREKSYFSPLVRAKSDYGAISLAGFHRRNYKEHWDHGLEFEADFLIQHKTLIFELIENIILHAQKTGAEKRILSNIFSHLVTANGEIIAIRDFNLVDGQIYLNQVMFPSVADLIEKSFVIQYAQVDSDYLLKELTNQPGPFPLFSGVFIFFLEALLQVDQCATRPKLSENIIHYHWGARNMAGIPPLREGYFFGSSVQRKIKTLFHTVNQVLGKPIELSIVLLPAAIFLLVPGPHQAQDADILSEYFYCLQRNHSSGSHSKDYLSRNMRHLSYNFWQKLRTHSFFDMPATSGPRESDLCIPKGFFDLPISLLSLALGELFSTACLHGENRI